MDTLRWAVMGTAAIAVEHVIPAIQQAAGCEVVAIASRDLERARTVAARHGIERSYDCYQQLLDDDAVDCVYLPLPNSLHLEWAELALRHGRAVLCEKPMGTSLHEVELLAKAAEGTGALLGEAFMYRFHPQFTRVRELVRGGTLGEVTIIRGSISFQVGQPPNIRLAPDLGGGALLDIGCYPLSAMCDLFDAAPLAAHGSATVHGVDESCAAVLEFPGDRIGVMDCHFRLPWFAAPLEVVGDRGMLRLDNAYNPGDGPIAGVLRLDGSSAQPFELDGVNMYRLMVESFGNALRQRRAGSVNAPDQWSIESSLRTATAIELVQRAVGNSAHR